MNHRKELPKTNFAYISSVNRINHKPHPFVVGPKHIEYASDHCGGGLGMKALKAFPCAYRKCKLSYDEHTYDYVAFVKLTRDCTENEVSAWLRELIEDWTKSYNRHEEIDGFAFLESGFSIIQDRG